MHEDGIVAEASERLQRAGLIPPVKSLEWQGDEEDADEEQPWINEKEWVLVKVTGPVSPELEAHLSEVLQGLAYEVRSLSPSHVVGYDDGTDYLPTE